MPLASQLMLLAITAPAAVLDYRSRRIPNWLTVPGLAAALLLNLALYGLAGLALAAMGAALAFALYLALYLLRGMGAGDLKLMTALGALLGPSDWLWFFLVTALVGGLLGGALAWKSGRIATTLHNMLLLVASLVRFRAPYEDHGHLDVRNAAALRLPHGVTICATAALWVAHLHA